jgi:hypothetical protein
LLFVVGKVVAVHASIVAKQYCGKFASAVFETTEVVTVGVFFALEGFA